MALVLIMVLAVNLHLLPATGIETAQGYIMPMMCTGLASVASYTRITRSSMLEVLGKTIFVQQEPRARKKEKSFRAMHCAMR